MTPVRYAPVYLGTWLLLLASGHAVFAVCFPGPWAWSATFVWSVVGAVGLTMTWRDRDRPAGRGKPIEQSLIVVTLLVAVACLISSGAESALVALLVGVQTARSFTLRSRRDFLITYLVSLIMVLYAASHARATAFVVDLILYVLAGVFTLMSDHIDERLARARGGDHTLLALGPHLPGKSLAVAAATLLVGCAIFLFLPRPPSPHIQAFPASGGSQFSNRFGGVPNDPNHPGPGKGLRGRGIKQESRHTTGPTQSGRQQFDSKTVMAYGGFQPEFDITRPGSDSGVIPNPIVLRVQADAPLYLRGRVFDRFDGRTWTSSTDVTPMEPYDNRFLLAPNNGPLTAQHVYVEQDQPNVVFAANRPNTLWFPASTISTDGDGSLIPPGLLTRGTEYMVASVMTVFHDRLSGTPDETAPGVRHLQYPDAASGAVAQLARTVTRGIEDPYERAAAIEAYLLTNYRYTLATLSEPPPADPVNYFLFERKEGHCEYFASAMVLMLRSVGIPARLATGYPATQKNPITGYFEIRRFDGHAWVEAYMDGVGWTLFEPTPPFELPVIKDPALLFSALIRYLLDDIKRDERVGIPGPVGKPQSRWLEKLLRWFDRAVDMLRAMWSAIKTYGPLVLVLLAASVALAYAGLRWIPPRYGRWRLQRARGGDPRRFVVLCYRELERMGAARGTAREPSVTPREYQAALRRCFPGVGEPAAAITDLLHRAAYSRHLLGTGDIEIGYRAYETIRQSLTRGVSAK
ncbi:MAG: transglutaminase TgpA family protein [Nitrospirota bacterium]